MISSRIRNLPHKANKYNRPHVLWIEPALHTRYQDNDLRIKFIRSLHATLKKQDRMLVLPLKQVWDEVDERTVFSNGTINQNGLQAFTKALDATVRFADTKVMRNYGIPFSQVFQKDKLEREMEEHITAFERVTSRLDVRRMTMMRQQHMRQQFVQIRNYFKNRLQRPQQQQQQQPRQHDRENLHRHRRLDNRIRGHICRRELFRKK